MTTPFALKSAAGWWHGKRALTVIAEVHQEVLRMQDGGRPIYRIPAWAREWVAPRDDRQLPLGFQS